MSLECELQVQQRQAGSYKRTADKLGSVSISCKHQAALLAHEGQRVAQVCQISDLGSQDRCQVESCVDTQTQHSYSASTPGLKDLARDATMEEQSSSQDVQQTSVSGQLTIIPKNLHKATASGLLDSKDAGSCSTTGCTSTSVNGSDPTEEANDGGPEEMSPEYSEVVGKLKSRALVTAAAADRHIYAAEHIECVQLQSQHESAACQAAVQFWTEYVQKHVQRLKLIEHTIKLLEKQVHCMQDREQARRQVLAVSFSSQRLPCRSFLQETQNQ